jgi:hypothetical protein
VTLSDAFILSLRYPWLGYFNSSSCFAGVIVVT